ncbi:MAG: HAD-IA family hydrolase [Pseudomonadota bacterium]
MIRVVLFDLDGTLADTAPDLGYALNLQLQRHGRAPLPIALIRPHASMGARGLLKLGFGIELEDTNFTSMRNEYLELYEQNLCRETALFPGTAELLNTLESRAILWGIVTNKPERFTLPLVKQLGLFDRAACVISGDTVARPKPHPDALFKALEETGTTPTQAIYIGDDERDIQAASAAQMKSIIAGYGYLGGDNAPNTWGAHATVTHPLEILNFL